MVEVKENPKVRKYLMRIMQRFMDTQDIYTEASKEAMIVESIRRVKHDVGLVRSKVFAINKLTGAITITVKDVNGEPMFEKKTAYNTDFGASDTLMVEGMDIRLMDNRTPVFHVHKISDVPEVQEKINEAYKRLHETVNNHVHVDVKALNKLNYTGTSIKIDLAMCDYLEEQAKAWLSVLSALDSSITYENGKSLKYAKGSLTKLVNRIEILKTETLRQAGLMYNEVMENVKVSLTSLKDAYHEVYRQYQQGDKLLENADKMFMYRRLVTQADIPMGTRATPYISGQRIVERKNETKILNELTGIPPENLYFECFVKGERNIPLPYYVGRSIKEETAVLKCELNGNALNIQTEIETNMGYSPIPAQLNGFTVNKIYSAEADFRLQAFPMVNWEAVKIESQADNDHCKNLIKADGRQKFWTRGLYKGGKWVWFSDEMNAVETDVTWTNWKTTPNVSGDGRYGIVFNTDGTWTAEPIENEYPAIISRKLRSITEIVGAGEGGVIHINVYKTGKAVTT